MEVPGSSKKMIATQEEMVEAKVPIPYRDQCAHLLIPLNKCRQAEFYLPWKCEAERHTYEKCEYELVMEDAADAEDPRAGSAVEVPQSAQSIPLAPKTANA
ncbi:UNVERIFIED_CONTAM: NADH dehydrogenase [ubiquinone] 1 beta subcomplex subunit [Sesamum radiatum]|uniref:NADH dehydrogenase [ubiquinone] 1 beta subcomplex subunit 7 n=1 Tax=Sesamum radiatum TaxID=300843 RepID=A0AAW2TXQ7_SESRA